MNKQINWRRIFTVVGGLLAGLFLLGITAAIIIILVGGAIGRPSMPVPSHMRTIAGTYQEYIIIFHKPIETKPNDTAHAFAYILAKQMDLHGASLYFVKDDSRSPKNIPEAVLEDPSRPDSRADPDFMRATLSYEIAVNIPLGSPPTTTPLLWSRGLRDDGTWAPDSPWQGRGGHIAYLDGHVEWYDKKISLDNNDGNTLLVKFGTTTPTVNIHEALPPGAVILSAEPNGAQR